MSRKNFIQGDWVTIKYGGYNGSYGKVSSQEKNGRYMILPYNESGEPGEMIYVSGASLELIEPLKFSLFELKAFARGEKLYSEFKDQVFPAFNMRAQAGYMITANDIACALKHINEHEDFLQKFKEWFWIIINIFYDDLYIKNRYREDYFSDAPVSDDDIFSITYSLTEKLYWRLEERFSLKEDQAQYIIKFDNPVKWTEPAKAQEIEEMAYKAVCEDILSRVDVYEYNKELPVKDWIYSPSQMRHVLASYEENEQAIVDAGKESVKLFLNFVEKMYRLKDVQALKILAWDHYEGSPLFKQDWNLAEKYLLELLEADADPYAANSLGYIYFYGRTNGRVPEYEKAFKYFSYGALAGIDESIYKLSDMLIKGLGTVKNIDMGLNLLLDGYKDSIERFCEGEYDNKFADYALRMGHAAKDGIIYGMGMRDAYKFYLEADFAIKKRMETADYFGDEKVNKNISEALLSMQKDLALDMDRTELKADFPLYISHMFDDRYPLKVTINVSKALRKGTLLIQRFRLGSEFIEQGIIPKESEISKLVTAPPILITYPELSYAALVTDVTYEMEEITVAQKPESGTYFLTDGFRRNDKTNALEFYANGEMVAVVEAKWYTIRVKKAKKNDADKNADEQTKN